MKHLTQACLAFALMAAAPASAEEALVGVQLPMTGAVASWAGSPIRRGIELAMDELKARGGSVPRLIVEDNASDKTQAITLGNRFIARDKVVAMIGPPTSPLAMAVAPIANQEQTPILALGVSEEITKAGPWAFKMYQNPKEIVLPVGRYAVDTLGAKSIAIVFGRDNEAMVAYKNIMRDFLVSKGVKKLTEESVLTADTDFTALATKLADGEHDAIYLATLPESAANIMIQARQAGLSQKIKLLGSDSLGAKAFVEIGGKAVEGTVYPALYFPGSPGEANKSFVESFRKKFNVDPDQYAAIGHTAMLVMAEAIRAAGPGATRAQIRERLAAIKNLPTALGTGQFAFDEARNPIYGSVLVEVKGGKLELAR